MRFDEAGISKSHSSALRGLKQETIEIADFDAHRLLRRTLALTSAEIEKIDLELAAEAGLLKRRRYEWPAVVPDEYAPAVDV